MPEAPCFFLGKVVPAVQIGLLLATEVFVGKLLAVRVQGNT